MTLLAAWLCCNLTGTGSDGRRKSRLLDADSRAGNAGSPLGLVLYTCARSTHLPPMRPGRESGLTLCSREHLLLGTEEPFCLDDIHPSSAPASPRMQDA